MTTALAWGFVVAVFAWKLGLVGDLWLSAFFLSAWAATALVQDEYRRRREAEFWSSVTIEREADE